MIGYAEAQLAQWKMIRWGMIVLEGELEDREPVLQVTRISDGTTKCACADFCNSTYTALLAVLRLKV